MRNGTWTGVRDLLLPAAIWLVLCVVGAGALSWAQQSSRTDLLERFDARVSLGSQFVSSYVQDVLARERTQAERFLSGKTVSDEDFRRSVTTFGYPAAVLVDSRGRVLHVEPRNPALIGKNLLGGYAHLRTAVLNGTPAVSAVVPSASRHVAVTAFAMPYETAYGRRVFSGAVEVARSPLSSYLTKALSIPGNRVYLVDGAGRTVAANRAVTSRTGALSTAEPALAAKLRASGRVAGTYTSGGAGWTFSAYPVSGTGWRLIATVPDSALYAPLSGATTAGRVGLATAATVGLIAVAVAARGARSRRELRLSEQRFRTVFDRSLVGMAIVDLTGRFRQANQAFCTMLGYSPDALLQLTSADVTHPDDRSATDDPVREALAGTTPGFTLEKRYLRADGHVVHGATTATLLRDLENQPAQFTVQVVDITERKRLEAEEAAARTQLAEHADELERTNDDLTDARDRMADFVAMLSHDVRQPITGILGYAETLADDWEHLPEPRKKQYLLGIAGAGHRLNGLVEDILTVAQLDAGVLTPKAVPVELRAALHDAVLTLPPDEALDVTVSVPDGTYVRADPGHLQQIVTNLLGNAVKYGAPPFDLTAAARGAIVELCVCDHGEGVPPEFVPQLFDRFSRAETGVATTKRGTGLGLYIVRTLADAGRIGLGYRPNRPTGACFVVELAASSPDAVTTAASAVRERGT
ncbi:sensor histidine kinase [Cryptosporangium phraense]|uniref:Sensor-like histidine kinase SenX3 n=1 Tax=Cryptosporangium phraense TaxID=2593070 RepID=A0A545AFW9_9ACTN|nr:sensor histidine kinase [Cryptosporangium phraense]TQS40223.1 PAS domain S-box protein [Cryptosporangium phraense]